MEDKSHLIAELREKFLKRLEDEDQSNSKFHPADVTRAKTRDDWLRRFLEHNDFNVTESLDMMWDTCEWRKKFGANDITEDNVRKEYLEDGICFPYSKDKDGKTLFVIKSKLHVKGVREFSELQRCVVYWFERLEREGHTQITLFFDMNEAGLSNLDLEFTKYLISLFKCYYPNFLNYIIILEMPWVLNAAFKIIKSWLPAKAIPKIKLVNKTSLKEWVKPADALKCWGGEDDFTFVFIPMSESAIVNGKFNNSRKVHFNEESPLSDQPNANFGDKEKMISIDPEVLVFNRFGDEISCTFTLKNITDRKSLSYKLKTTSPEKFRVRPSSGILQPGQQCAVKVVLQSGYLLRGFLHNDRFLLMCIPLSDSSISSSELADLWKHTGEESIEQHRLLCKEAKSENGDLSKSQGLFSSQDKRTFDALFNKVDHTHECCEKLYKEVRAMKHLLIVTIILAIGVSIVAAYLLKIDFKFPLEDQHCRLRNE